MVGRLPLLTLRQYCCSCFRVLQFCLSRRRRTPLQRPYMRYCSVLLNRGRLLGETNRIVSSRRSDDKSSHVLTRREAVCRDDASSVVAVVVTRAVFKEGVYGFNRPPPPKCWKIISHCEKICNNATSERLLLSATLLTY